MKRLKLLCDDCRADIVALGEYYMAQPKIWEQELGLRWRFQQLSQCAVSWTIVRKRSRTFVPAVSDTRKICRRSKVVIKSA
ncbi:MAG TPA: hypothetical protein VHW69_01135, partial [Rhizomicrobium sp.]|nr:hypothetical protein [Rhizomicrobium sp.]